jgi:methionyl-tRNA formyltransferase
MSPMEATPIRTVVFVDWSPVSAILLRALHEGGHSVVAVIVHERDPGIARERRWGFMPGGQLSPRLAIAQYAKDAVFLTCCPSKGWTAIAETLRSLRPDLLVCCSFFTRIPPEILAIPRYGAVNFHPARLPQYRGSAPLFYLVLENREEQDGGVTLHEMTDRIDAGAIIAFARLPAGAWCDVPSFVAAIAGARKTGRSASLPRPTWPSAVVRDIDEKAAQVANDSHTLVSNPA